jgi:hypothetical protein
MINEWLIGMAVEGYVCGLVSYTVLDHESLFSNNIARFFVSIQLLAYYQHLVFHFYSLKYLLL